MAVVTTVMNMKGGVGKTTVALHLGGMVSRYQFGSATNRRRVLLIDYDPQFNLSQALLPPKTYFKLESERKTTIAILLDDDANLDPYTLQVPGNHTPPKVANVASPVFTAMDLVPSTLDLMYVALGQAETKIQPIEERFQKFIDECRTLYDVILIDCHPAGSVFTKTALLNSDHVLIPVAPERYAVRGVGLMLKFIAAKKAGTAGPMPHILFNKTARRGVTSEEANIRSDSSLAPYCMTNTLKWYSAFAEPEAGAGFVWSSRKPWSTSAFQNLVNVTEEFLIRIGA